MIKPKGMIYFVTKKIELVPTTAEQSAEYALPQLLHHPVRISIMNPKYVLDEVVLTRFSAAHHLFPKSFD